MEIWSYLLKISEVFAFSSYFVDFLLTSIHFPISVRTVLRVLYAFGNRILFGNRMRAYTSLAPGTAPQGALRATAVAVRVTYNCSCTNVQDLG